MGGAGSWGDLTIGWCSYVMRTGGRRGRKLGGSDNRVVYYSYVMRTGGGRGRKLGGI